MQYDPEVISDYYVYIHKDPTTGVPFYVGKGRGKRAYAKTKRHPHWHTHVETLGGKFEIEIVRHGLQESEAFEHEAELIKAYGKLSNETGTLVNWTDGGEGELGYVGIMDLFNEDQLDPDSVDEIQNKERLLSHADYQEDAQEPEAKIIKGYEREQLSKNLLDFIVSFRAEIGYVYGIQDYAVDECEDDDYLDIFDPIHSAWDDAARFVSKKISCQEISNTISDLIDDLTDMIDENRIENIKAREAIAKHLPQLKEFQTKFR